jgi:hypothetical protein
MATMPTRIDGDLFEAAKAAGLVHSRSAAQQLDHWARIGRELEASPSVTHDTVERVLTGKAAYDEVDDRSQAVVRAAWNEDVAARISALDLTERLEASGTTWAEADANGDVVVRGGGATAG